MAIIANRAKKTSNFIEFSKIIWGVLNRFLIIWFIVFSIYIWVISPKKLSEFSLEITGGILSTVSVVYEDVFKFVKIIPQKLKHLQDISQENIELRLELALLHNLQEKLETLRAENIALRKLMLTSSEENYQYITAKLLSVSLNPFSQTAIILAGTKHGVAVDQVVVNSQGLIGRIVEVSSNYSKMMLVNDKNSRIPVIISSSGEKGVLAGVGKTSKILYLPSNQLIQKGEKVVTSGYGDVYPSGIIVGEVSKVIGNETFVSSTLDLSNIEFVKILFPYNR